MTLTNLWPRSSGNSPISTTINVMQIAVNSQKLTAWTSQRVNQGVCCTASEKLAGIKGGMQEKFCASLKEFGLQQNWRAQHFLQGLRRELQTLMSSNQRFCAPLRPSHTKVEERSGNWSPEQDLSGKSLPRCPDLSEGRWEGGGIRGRVLGGHKSSGG